MFEGVTLYKTSDPSSNWNLKAMFPAEIDALQDVSRMKQMCQNECRLSACVLGLRCLELEMCVTRVV